MIKRFVFALLSSALVTSVAHAGGHCAGGVWSLSSWMNHLLRA